MFAHDKLWREDSTSALLLLPNKLSENDVNFPSKYPDYQPEVFHNPPNGFHDHSSSTNESGVSFSQCEKKYNKTDSIKSKSGIPCQTLSTVPDLDVVEVPLGNAEQLHVVQRLLSLLCRYALCCQREHFCSSQEVYYYDRG